MNLKPRLEQLLAKTDLVVSNEQVELLVGYVELLAKWNKAYNLTSVRDPEEMLVKHILDSLAIGPLLSGKDFIDVGTGPGLPGIPLAILYPERNFVLLDTLGKRVTFLRQVVFQLKLLNVIPVKTRVEQYQPEKPFDGVLSRAFASLKDMLTWCGHLTNEHGRFYALKGQYPDSELEQLPEGFSLEQTQQVFVPELEGERHLITLKK